MPSKSFLVSLLLTVAESEPLNLKQIQYHFLQGFIRPSGLERQTKQHLSSPNPCGCMFFNTQIEDFNQRPMFLNRNRDEGGSIHGPRLVMGAQPNTLDGFWPWLWMVQTVASSFLVPHYLYRLSIRCLFFLQGDSALHRCDWSPSALQSDADVFWTVDTVFILSVNGAKSDSSWFVSGFYSALKTTQLQYRLCFKFWILTFSWGRKHAPKILGRSSRLWYFVNNMLQRLNSDTLLGIG